MRKIRERSNSDCVGSAGDNRPFTTHGHRNIGLQAFPPPPVRWLPQRKAEILAAVRQGTITLDEACRIYQLSVEEFMSWQRGNALHGLAGLRATPMSRKRDAGSVNQLRNDVSVLGTSATENG